MESAAIDRIDLHGRTSAVRSDPDQRCGRARLSQLRAQSMMKTAITQGPSIRGAI